MLPALCVCSAPWRCGATTDDGRPASWVDLRTPLLVLKEALPMDGHGSSAEPACALLEADTLWSVLCAVRLHCDRFSCASYSNVATEELVRFTMTAFPAQPISWLVNGWFRSGLSCECASGGLFRRCVHCRALCAVSFPRTKFVRMGLRFRGAGLLGVATDAVGPVLEDGIIKPWMRCVESV
jgi:hypothetical protein